MTAKSTQNVKSMDRSYAAHEWLEWLTRVRLLMIALILSVGIAWPTYLPLAGSSRYFLPLIIFWVTLGTIQMGLVRWLPRASWHGAFQVACDVLYPVSVDVGVMERPRTFVHSLIASPVFL